MKYLTVLAAIVASLSAPAQITNVEHFYASSPNAEKLFHFFKENFELPTVWHYGNWGTWASGGLMLGNTPLEFLRFTNDTSTTTRFAGIALEPRVRVDSLIYLYDGKGLAHGKPFVDTFMQNGVKDTGFVNLRIKEALPSSISFFTCDYKYRGEMDTIEMKAADSLKSIRGGPLGIIALKEIVVGCNDLTAYSTVLAKLPGIKQEKNHLFRFSKGPALQLINAANEGIQKIIVEVNSLRNARTFLQQKNLLGTSTDDTHVIINPQAINGLIVELTDK